jgi:hypothetical protein
MIRLFYLVSFINLYCSMKTIFTLLFSSLCLSAGAQTIYPGNIAGCVAQWSFNLDPGNTNILNDFSGNNNSGVPYNISPTSSWRGIQNQAGRFDGSTS